jgi:hypothetical protein
MSQGNKNGQKPASQKAELNIFNDTQFNDNLAIPQSLKNEAASQGFELRFVDYKKMAEFGGVHKNGWQAYSRKKGDAGTMDSAAFQFGNDPNGIIRRGTLILAYRPVSMGDQHRAMLEQRAARYRGNYHRKQAEEMKQSVKESGLPSHHSRR